MDWKIFIATFSTIFLAEMGDKTQFAALAVAAQSKSILSVLLGTILALTVAGTLGVLAGSILGQYLDPAKMKVVSGGAFIVMGAWILFR